MALKQFSNKVVVITGSSSGFGAAAAVEFALQGASLMLHGRNVERLEETRRRCVEAGLGENQVATVVCDLIKDQDAEQTIFSKTMEVFGKINVLFLNAGIVHPDDGPVATRDRPTALDDLYKIFVRSPFCLVNKCAEEIGKSKGSIIFNSSVLSDAPRTSSTAYGIAKAAQEQMLKVMAIEFADKDVRVNAVRPGFVDTNLLRARDDDGMVDEKLAYMAELTPLGKKLATPEDVARVVIFLASEQASCLTGVSIICDNGFSMMRPHHYKKNSELKTS